MIIKQGDMFKDSDPKEALFITGNSTIKTNGAVVMGRGAAKQLRDLYPGIDKELGSRIQDVMVYPGFYGVALCGEGFRTINKIDRVLGVVQVKTHYSEVASVRLIDKSLTVFSWFIRLSNSIVGYDINDSHIHINFPGIGNGHLQREDVLPLLSVLPSNVVVWER